ncbi:hypothetical protein KKC63_02345 [Patescibacteria group bacterium]|nr:hypothetical protein [Patescibacteria group bacterium]MBU4023393.1 hypothetical protein [Patescibacteria group bacterium]
MEELSRDKLWEIYKTLCPELKDAIFSEDTADAVWNIAKLHEIKETSKLGKLAGQVLMGLLPLEFFKDTIKDELGLSEDIAKKASMEMEHYVFNQVKKELNELYAEAGIGQKEKPEIKEETTEQSRGPDSYREPIE